MDNFSPEKLAMPEENGRLSQFPTVSYIDVPEFVLRDCPLCLRVAVLAAKGCHERRYRIYCDGLTAKPKPTCTRQTDWWHTPEAAETEWNLDHDVPLPLFPDQILTEKTG